MIIIVMTYIKYDIFLYIHQGGDEKNAPISKPLLFSLAIFKTVTNDVKVENSTKDK